MYTGNGKNTGPEAKIMSLAIRGFDYTSPLLWSGGLGHSGLQIV